MCEGFVKNRIKVGISVNFTISGNTELNKGRIDIIISAGWKREKTLLGGGLFKGHSYITLTIRGNVIDNK